VVRVVRMTAKRSETATNGAIQNALNAAIRPLAR